MEIAKLEAIYTANDSGLERVSARADARFKQTAKEAGKTEKAIGHAFRTPPPGLTQSLTAVNQHVGTVSGSMLSLKSIAAGVFAGFTISSVVSQLQQAAAAVLTFKSNLETSQIAFTTMLGSVDLANKHLQDLQKFALSTPFEFEGLVNASKRMQAMGFEARQVIPILTDVGNAVASVGGSREVLDRVILALSQIQAKGKVSAQEMNQLAEAGIPAWRLLSEELGQTRAETIKLAEEGKISGQVFLDAFRKFSQANFGGMMERQSRTFAGAMSNIRDTLLQTAGSAFDPLFRRMAEVADRISQELQSGKPTLENSFRVMVSGLTEIAGSAGAQLGSSLLSGFLNRVKNPSEWSIFVDTDAFLRGVFGGIPDPLDLFGLGEPAGPITQPLTVPDVKAPLQKLTQDQKQNSEAAQRATEIYKDLAMRVAFYGQSSEKAAVQQRLLAIGMDALTSAEGRRAVQLAELIDKQRISAQLTESQKQFVEGLAAITENKYRNALQALSDTTQDAITQTAEFASAQQGGLTALERFNFGMGAQVQGMIDTAQASAFTADQIGLLSLALANARTAFKALTDAQEENKQKEEARRIGEQRTELLRSLRGLDVDLGRQIRGAPTDAIQQLAEQLEGLSFLKVSPGGFDLFVEKVRSGSVDAKQAIAEIGTALSAARGDLGPELFDRVTASINNLFLNAKQLTELLERQTATERYRDTLASLLEIINRDVQLTNAQRIEKLLLTDAYKNLTEAQIASLRATAMEADIAERLRADREARMQSMKEVAEDLGGIFASAFDSIQGGWSDMWRDMARIARNVSRQIVQELITGLFSRAFNVPFTSQSGGLVGGIINRILGSGSGTRTTTDLGGGSVFTPGGTGATRPRVAGSRALGGPVEAGRLYKINERGTEYFQPNIGGQVIPLRPQEQAPNISRLYIVDDERAAFERGATRREIAKVNKQMRKIGKLVPAG